LYPTNAYCKRVGIVDTKANIFWKGHKSHIAPCERCSSSANRWNSPTAPSKRLAWQRRLTLQLSELQFRNPSLHKPSCPRDERSVRRSCWSQHGNSASCNSSSRIWKGQMFSTHIWSQVCKGFVST